VVLLATGYAHKRPFLDEAMLGWKNGRPQLYLDVFSGAHDSLYILGSSSSPTPRRSGSTRWLSSS
jgi:hypothetical protein